MRARHLYPQGACSLEGGDRTQTPKGMASQGRVANAVFGGEAQEPRGPTGGGAWLTCQASWKASWIQSGSSQMFINRLLGPRSCAR